MCRIYLPYIRRVGQFRMSKFLIPYYTVFSTYIPYNPRIPYCIENRRFPELSDRGVIVQLLKSTVCISNLSSKKKSWWAGPAQSCRAHPKYGTCGTQSLSLTLLSYSNTSISDSIISSSAPTLILLLPLMYAIFLARSNAKRFLVLLKMLPNKDQFRSVAQLVTCADNNRLATLVCVRVRAHVHV